MFFSATVLAAALVAPSFVSAAPLQRRSSIKMSSASVNLDTAVGAVYFITNEGDINTILAANINSDGTLVLDRAITTGGSGAHGLEDLEAPDPLFSQASIKASAEGEVLAAVNAGSNSITLFAIDPADPTNLQQIGNPASSEGEFPVSLAFNSKGDTLCVLNSGTVNGVNCFDVDKVAGLTGIPNSLRSLGLNQTNPATGLENTASQVLFSEDDTQLLVSVKGDAQNPGFIAVFDVQADGSLSDDFKQIPAPQGGALPFSMTLIPGTTAVVVPDPQIGFDIIDFVANTTTAVKIDGQKTTGWSSFSVKTGDFFLTDLDTSTITEVNVDENLKATIVNQFEQGAGTTTMDNDIATVGDTDFLYVLAPNATVIDIFEIIAAGKLQSVATLDLAGPAQDAGITLNAFNIQGLTTFVPVDANAQKVNSNVNTKL
ncbi:hypothetical protein C8Q80DRAFT_26133 [Daedaleopsis nitida]|nr:hypothetical protein C8Q80DRAFT_26133 [Daedaleopsis nitida]